MKTKLISRILAVQTVLCILVSAIPPIYAESNIITINSREDFFEFSKKCTLDSYSQGKTVNLACDINFSNNDFLPVASFGGEFNGNGYTLSGINLDSGGSYKGVFRYVCQGGKISNLNISAKIIPSGSKSFAGGIAGENSGTIENCTFSGNIKGENVIGGIAGHNTDNGRIISCRVSGSIIGENSTGGIVGKNSGFIQNCENNALINTVYEEKKNTLTDIDTDTGAIIENRRKTDEENEEKSILGHSDTGGIAGYTCGIIQGCKNNTDVGYKHIGYNVGGIAGRQSGYILGCENHGTIRGRKDVGGIVGQSEPYILLNTSQNNLKNLKSELNTLSSMINRFITDADSLGDDAEKYLNGISDYAKTAGENAEALINGGTDFVDDNLSELNAQAAIFSNTLDKLIPIFDSLESGSENLTDALNDLIDALDGIKFHAPDLDDEIDDIKDAVSRIESSEESIKKAHSKFNKAVDHFEEGIKFKNVTRVKNAIYEMSAALKQLITAKQKIRTELNTIERILNSKPEDFEEIGIKAKKIAESLKKISEYNDTVISSVKTIKESIDAIILNTTIDFDELEAAATSTKFALGYLNDAVRFIKDGLSDLASALESTYDKLYDYTDEINDELTNTKKDLSDSLSALSYANDDIKACLDDLKDIITDLSEEKPLEFVKLGDDFRTNSDKLFDSVSGISDELDGLKNTLLSKGKTISGDLTSISNQFNIVMNLMIGELEDLENHSLSDIFIDISDTDIENAKQGKTEDCVNYGEISADRNTGGIAGAMAIEYAKDPEDDTEKPNTLNFTYRSRAVVQSCINNAEIIGKKDCVGGIVGNAELGTVYNCENYGKAESENGNCVGGIAGNSDSGIRKCYSKASVSGKRYVGGIAGKGKTVTSSYSITSADGTENIGAVCGYIQNNDNVYRNFFVDNGLGAIDGISYASHAEPIEYDLLKNMSGIPKRFISFTATFKADEKIVATQDIAYGADTESIKYPSAPEKYGCFSKWQKLENSVVTGDLEIICEYIPYITVISSKEKDNNGKLALALSDGKFTDEAVLHIKESKAVPPVSSGENVKVYDITLLNTDISETDSVNIRILSENKNKATAWVLTDGKWEKTKTTLKGKYTVLQVRGSHGTVCLKYENHSFGYIIILALILALAAVLTVLKKRCRA